ncbi:MAG: ubiquinone-binding protein [Methylocystaceae bacterium]|nr:MAG: ubiquinone-binding protein [Methylocystaceae bacterium]
MKSFRNRRRVPFSADDMFALVKDVEAYPKFVPLCEGLRVRRRTRAGEGVEVIVAEMQVGFKAICERFASRVTCDAEKREILVEYIDGPFKKLENRWSFHDEPAGPNGEPRSVVDFYINYEFKSRALGLVMGAMFDSAFHKYADAFVKRAGEVYGRR